MRYLIVGAGFSGATLARELAEAGHSVVVIDKRMHVAGNAYDEECNGIRFHKYGPHLFHTKNKRVYDYLSKFTTWLDYRHKVKALLSDGQYVTLPVNRETKDIVGEENIIDTFFRPYTKKMWGMDIEELDKSILNRVPVRDDDNEYYFPDDPYQGLPDEGYTKLISNMLSHDNIRVYLGISYSKIYESEYDHVFNSMPIDMYYDYQYGELPYRSIIFSHNTLDLPRALPTATVNFTHDGPHTRVTEWKNLPGHDIDNPYQTMLTFEEPCDYKDNDMERYYPVKDVDGKNRAIYEKYKNIPNDKVTFIGRCGQYVYIDMDMAVNASLQLAEKFKQWSDE